MSQTHIIFNRSDTRFTCNFKSCKVWYSTQALLTDHVLTEHDCDHLNCTTKCKNQVSLKEHKKNKHGLHCEVTCLGISLFNTMWFLSLTIYILGQTFQLERNMETGKFECPHCSQAIDSIRTVQKHCKDHIADSSTKHVTGPYHPYANTHLILLSIPATQRTPPWSMQQMIPQIWWKLKVYFNTQYLLMHINQVF